MGAKPGWYPDLQGRKRYWDGNSWHDAVPAAATSAGGINAVGWIAIGLAALIVLVIIGGMVHGGDRSKPSPVPPGASSEDIAFLRAMDSHGISNEKGSRAEIDLAHRVCDLLGGGMTVNGLAQHYSLTTKSGLSGDDMRYFVETAAAIYCPQSVR